MASETLIIQNHSVQQTKHVADSCQVCDITPRLYNIIIYGLMTCSIKWTIHSRVQKLKGDIQIGVPPDLLIYIFWKHWEFAILSMARPFLNDINFQQVVINHTIGPRSHIRLLYSMWETQILLWKIQRSFFFFQWSEALNASYSLLCRLCKYNNQNINLLCFRMQINLQSPRRDSRKQWLERVSTDI